MLKKIMILSTILFFCATNFTITKAQDKDKNEQLIFHAMRSITSIECLDHVKYLASDECAGRAPGSEGFNKAAQYVADEFKNLGLLPIVGDSSYFQEFVVNRNKISADTKLSLSVLIEAPAGNDTLQIDYEFEKDFIPSSSTKSCNIRQQIVLVGYGITSPENKWDDYKDVDVKDKVVMVLGGAPSLKEANWGRIHRLSNKVKFAQSAGASCLIIIGGNPIGTISSYQNMPVIIISEKVANDMLKGTSFTVVKLKNKINENQKSVNLNLSHQIHLKIQSELQLNCKTMNILGYLKGSDDKLCEEYIVVGAHVDHLGQMGEHTFYGANDNASGTAIVMEIAEAFAKMEHPPKRSLLFIAFTAEEMGLLGAKHYVKNPILPLKNGKAMINLDMVGSGDDAFMIVGGHTFPKFTEIFDKYSERYVHFPIKRRWTSPNSDHYPFHDAGIPSVFLYAMQGVASYHTTWDTSETLDAETMEAVGRLVFLVINEIANAKKVNFPLMEKKK